jgi:catechol 2,3-dioxygenase-like lactoylglutathione lyase family enzyme
MGQPGLTFAHFGMFVTQLAPMEHFYTELLGFTVTDRGQLNGPNGPFELLFLSRDPEEHHQLVLATGRPAELSFNPINQISFRADSLATLRSTWRKLEQAGARELVAITHGNAVSVYGRDPEGNRLEIYFNLPWYVTQPLREPVDLAMPDDALMAWLEAHARSLPGFEPRELWRARIAAKMGVA